MSELEKQINGLDPEDIGLKGIFGERFHDESRERPNKRVPRKNEEVPAGEEKTAQALPERVLAAQWEPVRPEPNAAERLKDCALRSTVYGGLSLLVFYWENAGLMAESIAVPCMCACAVLFGLHIGKHLAKESRR